MIFGLHRTEELCYCEEPYCLCKGLVVFYSILFYSIVWPGSLGAQEDEGGVGRGGRGRDRDTR